MIYVFFSEFAVFIKSIDLPNHSFTLRKLKLLHYILNPGTQCANF